MVIEWPSAFFYFQSELPCLDEIDVWSQNISQPAEASQKGWCFNNPYRAEPEETGWIQFQNLFQNQYGNFSQVQFGDLSFSLGKLTPFTFMIKADMYGLNSVILLSYLNFPLFSIFSYIMCIFSLSLLLFSLPGNLEEKNIKFLFCSFD